MGFGDLVHALAAADVAAHPEDVEVLPAERSDPETWEWSSSTCPFVRDMVSGWGSDDPRGTRQNWMLATPPAWRPLGGSGA